MSEPHPLREERIPVEANSVLISRTDTSSRILYANQEFIRISGFSEAELLGNPHNIVRHPDMPRAVYHLMWQHLKDGKEFNGYIKNRTKNGGYYWVFANIGIQKDQSKTIYMSVRRRPQERALNQIFPHYQEMCRLESGSDRDAGLQRSCAYFETLYQDYGKGYDEFVFSL